MKQLLVVEDSTLRAMMDDPRIMKLLPCLKQPKTKLASVVKGGANCSRCNFQKKQIATNAIKAAKGCVKNARGATLKSLKKILKVKNLRLLIRNKNGGTVKYTI